MNITIESLPIYFLIFVGIGVGIVFIGILKIAGLHEEGHYTNIDQEDHLKNVEELFSYFLEEEEKKNQSFREMIVGASKNKSQEAKSNKLGRYEKTKQTSSLVSKQDFEEIIKRHQSGESIEEIARNLKKGIGEVKLVISLYSMR